VHQQVGLLQHMAVGKNKIK